MYTKQSFSGLVSFWFAFSHEIVNINLQQKPDWFVAKAPFGAVPVLEQGSKIIHESAIIDEYLE